MRYLALILLLTTGCSWSPLRVFKATVPPPIVKPDKQLEAERRAADLIARKIETPVELKPVAVGLAASLGAPAEPIPVATPAELPKAAAQSTAELNAALLAMQRQIVALNHILVKYQGKDIEGTGLSLLGPGATAIIIGLIVLAVACPPALTLMAFAYRRLKAAAGIIVDEVEKASEAPETKNAVDALKSNVRQAMDEHKLGKHLKNVILDLKKS